MEEPLLYHTLTHYGRLIGFGGKKEIFIIIKINY